MTPLNIELHIDYTVAQHLSEAFGIGVTGYYYNQPSDEVRLCLASILNFYIL